MSCDNKVKVGDFSSAMICKGSNHFSLNFGTPCYTAPEIYNQDNYDNKVDIWSLGWIIYELCTGRKAFDSTNVETLKSKITNGKPPKIVFSSNKPAQKIVLNNTPHKTTIKVDINYNNEDEDLQNIYLWWVQKDPQNRPSAEDILSLAWVSQKAKFLNLVVPNKFTCRKRVIDPSMLNDTTYDTKNNTKFDTYLPYEEDNGFSNSRRMTFDDSKSSKTRKSQKLTVLKRDEKQLIKNNSTKQGVKVMLQNFTETKGEEKSRQLFREPKFNLKSDNHRKEIHYSSSNF